MIGNLVRSVLARVRPATPPAVTSRSRLAVQAARQWEGDDRPRAWRDHEYGLVLHTTGGGLPSKALARGLYPTALGTEVYRRSHGCHYLLGWRGLEGDLLQLADDREQAAGVGISPGAPNQWASVEKGPGAWEHDLPDELGAAWRARWPGWANPLDLLPGTRSANAPYLHLEVIPCVFNHNGKLHQAAEPMRKGLRFTWAQHDAIAALARDVADRKQWPLDLPWWRTPRLVGHEDLTPISRHDRHGGWDPGALRSEPYIDLPYIYERIAASYGRVDPGGLTMLNRRLVRSVAGQFAQY